MWGAANETQYKIVLRVEVVVLAAWFLQKEKEPVS